VLAAPYGREHERMTTPDDQDWLRTAEDAFGDLPDSESTEDNEQPRWRYRSPVA
jgi:hypothetical protein